MKKLLLPFILFLPTLLQAQLEYKWANATRMQFNSNIFNTRIAPDLSGGAYHSYAFSDSITPNPQNPNFYVGGSVNASKVVVSRINHAGSLVFHHLFQTSAEFSVKDIASDSNGNVYVAGSARYTFGGTAVDLDPSSGVFNINSNCLFMAKYDSLGNFISANKFNIESYLLEIFHLTIDNSNKLLISGSFSYGAHFSNTPGTDTVFASGNKHSFIAQYDNNFNLNWFNTFRNDRPVDFGMGYGEQTNKPNGNAVVALPISGTINLSNGFSYNASGNFDILLLEFSSNGVILNNHILSSTGNADLPLALTSDGNNNIILAGNTEGTMDIDPLTGTTSVSAFRRFFVKYDNNFGLLWYKEGQMGNTIIKGASTTSSNEIIIAGNLRGTWDFDFNAAPPNTYQISSNGGTNYDIFIVKYDANGQPLFAKNFGTNANTSQFEKIVLNNADDVFLSGRQSDVTDMNFGSAINTIVANSDPYNFSVKYAPCITSTSLISASICQGSAYSLPGGGTATVSGTYNHTFQTVNGCDSIVSTTLTVMPSYSFFETTSICNGNTYTLPDGNIVSAAGVYTTHLFSINGCDSSITTTLLLYPSYSQNESVSICQGDNHLLPDGNTTNAAGTYISHLYTTNGCDSIITTTLTVNTVNTSVTQTGNLLSANATGAGYQWLDCNNGFAILTGETSQTFSASANGNYAVMVSENGCSDTSICFLTTVTSVALQSEDRNIKVYPNPTSELINIDHSEKISFISIFDISGKLVIKENGENRHKMNISCKELSNGIYFIHIDSDQHTEVFRLFVQH